MKTDKKITVVVPVYNVESFLRECIKSITRQTYTNIEIIIIDDGSTDKSGIICDEMASKDIRIKVIHKDNEGVSIARNLGIEEATGELITFIDADDFLEENMFERMMKYYEEKSLITCSYNIIKNNIKNNIENTTKDIEKFSIKNALMYLASREKIQGYTWNKIFSTLIIKQNNLRFIDSIDICEDLCFVAKYMLYIENVIYIHENLYNYRIRDNSATAHKTDIKKRITILDAYIYLIKLYNDNNIETIYLKYWLLKEASKIKLRYYKSKKDNIYIKYYEDIINKEYYYQVIRSNNIKFKEKIKLIICVILAKMKCK